MAIGKPIGRGIRNARAKLSIYMFISELRGFYRESETFRNGIYLLGWVISLTPLCDLDHS